MVMTRSDARDSVPVNTAQERVQCCLSLEEENEGERRVEENPREDK